MGGGETYADWRPDVFIGVELGCEVVDVLDLRQLASQFFKLSFLGFHYLFIIILIH